MTIVCTYSCTAGGAWVRLNEALLDNELGHATLTGPKRIETGLSIYFKTMIRGLTREEEMLLAVKIADGEIVVNQIDE